MGALWSGAVLVLAIVFGFMADGAESAAHPALVEDRVVVLEFENRTGDPALETVGRMASDWTAHGLKRTGLVQVLGPVGAEHVPGTDELGEASSAGWRSSVGRETGAGTAVWGSLYGDSSALYLQVHVSSVATGELLGGLLPVRVTPAAPAEAVDRVAQDVMGLLASRFDPRLEAWAKTAPEPPSYEAYREFVAGLEIVDIDRLSERVQRYLRAWEKDTTFVLPLLEAASYPGQEWRYPELRDSVWRLLEEREGRLSRVEAHQIKAARALGRGDMTGWYRHFREAAELAPHLLYRAANAALHAGRYREAVEILKRPDFPPMWRGYPWSLLTSALHRLGEHERELEAARRAREAKPGSLRPMAMEVSALAALGRTAEIEKVLEAARTIEGTPRYPSEMVILSAGIELLLHDRQEIGRRLLREADRGLQKRLADGRAQGERGHYLWWRASNLLRLEEYEEAQELAETWLRQRDTLAPWQQVPWQGKLGLAAAGAGDEATLEAALALLQSVDHVAGNNATWQRAQIAGQLGQCDRAVALLRESMRWGASHALIHRSAGLLPCRDHPDLIEFAGPRD